MSAINPVSNQSYVPQASGSSTAASSSPTSTTKTPASQDAIELSLAGRIALGVGAGRLTTDQATQLYSQLKDINSASGSSQTQLESQLSQQIYSDGHNGAAIPTGLTVTPAEARDFEQAGRIVTQENAGNLTSTQASQLFGQMKQIYQQSQAGATALQTNQAQNLLSVDIFDTAHNVTAPTSPTTQTS